MKFFSHKLPFWNRRTKPSKKETNNRTASEEEIRTQSSPKDSSPIHRENSKILVLPFHFTFTKRKSKYLEPVNLETLPRTDSRSTSTFKMMGGAYGIRRKSSRYRRSESDQETLRLANRSSSTRTTSINETAVTLDSLPPTLEVMQLKDVK